MQSTHTCFSSFFSSLKLTVVVIVLQHFSLPLCSFIAPSIFHPTGSGALAGGVRVVQEPRAPWDRQRGAGSGRGWRSSQAAWTPGSRPRTLPSVLTQPDSRCHIPWKVFNWGVERIRVWTAHWTSHTSMPTSFLPIVMRPSCPAQEAPYVSLSGRNYLPRKVPLFVTCLAFT